MKNVKKGKGLTSGRNLPYKNLLRFVISFYRHPASLAASPGDHAIFTCAIEGSPAPSIIWLKDGLKVVDDKAKNDQGRESTISELHILVVQEHHAGNYACKAANAMAWCLKECIAFLNRKTRLHEKQVILTFF